MDRFRQLDRHRVARREALKGALRSAVAITAGSAFTGRAYAAETKATGYKGNKVTLSDAAVMDLQKSLRGAVLLPTSPDYEETRKLWNGEFNNLNPAMIAKVATAEDVQNAVRFARAHDLLVAVRCGGHSYMGQSSCDGGLVIDMRAIGDVQVDAAAKTARVGGGALLGAMDAATMKYGLATTAGVIAHTGIGGLATGGGQGRLQRNFGMTVDNIRGVEVVTADGRLLKANATENADLYWAVRGGGGNFGIVTAFDMQLHAIDPKVTSYNFAFPMSRVKDAMKFYLDFSANAPDSLSVSFGLRSPEKGEATCSISGGFIGTPQAAEKLLEPIKVLGTPVGTPRLSDIEYVKIQSAGDAANPHGGHYYMRVAYQNTPDMKLGEHVIEVMSRAPVPGLNLGFSQQGGAGARVPVEATAYANRPAQYQLALQTKWEDPAQGPDLIKKVRERWNDIKPATNGGFYVNHAADEDMNEAAKNYGANYPRLVEIKTKYDPTNFFHRNFNIVPKKQSAQKT